MSPIKKLHFNTKKSNNNYKCGKINKTTSGKFNGKLHTNVKYIYLIYIRILLSLAADYLLNNHIHES